jgi:threonine dehydrogenase-like Zn-dependent dehydrogenase
VLGILGRDGAFAERLRLPVENLHLVPETVTDEDAVFTEPLAAAFQILDQVKIDSSQSVLIMGDGKLGLLCAQVLSLTGSKVEVLGKHRQKLELLEGIPTYLDPPRKKYNIVVEATGSPDGFNSALSYLHPRGTLVLKSTVAGKSNINLAPLVIEEITVVGSRCGPFNRALAALEKKEVKVDFLIEAIYPLHDIERAWKHAGRRGAKKILLKP